MPLATGTAINAAAMTGAKAAKQTVLFETRKKAAEKALELRQTPNVKAQTLTKAKNKFYKASDKLRAAKNSKMTKLHNWLEKPFEFFAKGGEKIAAFSPKLSKVAADLGTKATTFKPGFWGGVQKYSVKAAEYAVKGSSRAVSGAGNAVKLLSRVPKTGIFTGAFEAIFRAPELIQGLKEGRRVDAVGSYTTKVGGTAATAIAGTKLGFRIGKSIGGTKGAIIGTLVGMGISMVGSLVADKGADLVFGKNKGSGGSLGGAETTKGYSPAAANNTNTKIGFSANTLDIQKEWADLAQMGIVGNPYGLGYSGAMDYPLMMNTLS